MPSSSIYVVTNFLFPHGWIMFSCVFVHTQTRVHTTSPYLFICKGPLVLFLHLGCNEQCYSIQGSAAGSGQTVVWQQLLNDIFFSKFPVSLELSTSCPNPASPPLSLPLICLKWSHDVGGLAVGNVLGRNTFLSSMFLWNGPQSAAAAHFCHSRAAQGTEKTASIAWSVQSKEWDPIKTWQIVFRVYGGKFFHENLFEKY